MEVFGGDDGTDPRVQTQTVFQLQLYFCLTLGSIIFVIFCITRYKFPLVYSVRSYRNILIRKLPDDFFGWIKALITIQNDEFLQVAGLDAYVFLSFFRMGIKIFFTMAVLGVVILTPIRYLLTGKIDRDLVAYVLKPFASSSLIPGFSSKPDPDDPTAPGGSESNDPEGLLIVSTIFTYIFTAVVLYFLFKETAHVIRTRQRVLGVQKSVTDRTIFISNIPKHLVDEDELQEHIETLGVGKVSKITLMHDYSQLRALFEKRKLIIKKLEYFYSNHYGLNIKILSKNRVPSTTLKIIKDQSNGLTTSSSESSLSNSNLFEVSDTTPLLNTLDKKHPKKSKPTIRLSMFGPKLDAIDYFARELIKVDQDIVQLRVNDEFKSIPKAFVTMESVSDAQMAAQAIFSPNAFQLITSLAPAPMDVNWENLLLSDKSVFVRKNVIEVFTVLFSALLIIPIRYITSLLNVKEITKMWPEFGKYLLKHDSIKNLVTGLLPTYLFTIINVTLPYVISFLSSLQGTISKGDVELSIIRKNFLYIFFNLFLVFTLFGTWSSYKALLSDTTKIAPLLAISIKTLSLFYVDLILLQGLVMFPFKLLQIGDLSFIFWQYILCSKFQTPRAYRDLFYKPAVFDIGLILPQHMMIFIIVIIYSVISTKLLLAGLVYFILGYYTYKYQLVYSMVHLQHSTGKAWPIIFRRVCIGIFFLHLTMFGTLALEHSFVLAGFIVALSPVTILALMFFERNYMPLLFYIALDAIKTSGQSVDAESENNNTVLTFDDTIDDISNTITNALTGSSYHNQGQQEPTNGNGTYEHHMPTLRKRRSTIDEEREEFQSYTYPYLLDRMDGPWIGFIGDYIDTVEYYLNVDHDESAGVTEQADEIITAVKRRKNTILEYD